MILAHLADLHLGFRAYHRMSAAGINARERDVAQAFRAAIDRLLELRPDLVLIAGDIFHSVRPSNSAVTDAFRQFSRLAAGLERVPIVVIAGNHDSPRAAETGSILRLLAEIPNVLVVDDQPRTIHLAPLETSVLCLPHNALAAAERVSIDPDPSAKLNVLLLHGALTGGVADQKIRWLSEYGAVQIDTGEIRPERWDYVALGHYHMATALAPNMWYCGAIERTSNNIWEERTEKGFLTYDTDAGKATFHPLPTREVIDLQRFSALRSRSGAAPIPGDESRYLTAAEVDERIRERVEAIPGGIAGRIVRLVIEDVPREVLRDLDHKRVREWRAEALHFHLDARRPEVRRESASGAPGQRRTLEEEVRFWIERVWQPEAPGLSRDQLLTLSLRYLSEVQRNERETAWLDAQDPPGGTDGEGA